jgi:ribosomal protein S2|tara:strand:+ start:3906 stop:4070 length:165 start_codon:yes stop_codon:yes gene_type:complete
VFEIPAVGVVDTNTLTQSAAPPLPGNDDSSYAIIYYNSMYANFLLKRKFNSIIR